MKNKFIRAIAAGVLSLTLVSNNFVVFAEDLPSIDETPTIETTIEEKVEEDIEEIIEEDTTQTEEEIVPEDENLNSEEIVSEEIPQEEQEEEQIEEEVIEEENDIIEVEKTVENEETEIEKVISMPSISASESSNGMNISVNADEGAFPEGTTISISVIDDGTAESLAESAMGENVTSAKAVDITFLNKDGVELQPAIEGAVHVNISLDNLYQ